MERLRRRKIMKIESVDVSRLSQDPANARKHGSRNIESIKASLRRFGQQKPIVVDASNVVRAGNGTLEAARELGWDSVAVVRTGLQGAEATAYAIADNRSAELAEWDDEVLAATLESLQFEDDSLLADVGFDEEELKELLASVAEPSEVLEDEVPPVPDEAITQLGDVWTLGEHRLMCGDSTCRESVLELMAGSQASCVFTDPPYGVSIGKKNRLLNSIQRSGRCLTDIKDDDMTPAALKESLLPAFANLRDLIMADDCTLFVSAPQGGDLGMMMMMMMQEAGLKARHILIWKKNQPTFSMGRLDYDYQHEPILLTWGKRHKRPMKGTHRTSVWEIDRERKCDVHPTMKPVALYANAYMNNSDSGDTVADIYSGSGTAFIAAEQLGRRCFGMEISPNYCDVIVQRWENLTKKKAELSRGVVAANE